MEKEKGHEWNSCYTADPFLLNGFLFFSFRFQKFFTLKSSRTHDSFVDKERKRTKTQKYI
jgi:hypothetical protein